MNKKQWRESVTAGRKAVRIVREGQWAIADACKDIPWGLMPTWKDEVGTEYSVKTLEQMSTTARAWPKSKRSKAAFSTHVRLNALDERFEVIHDKMTKSEAVEVANGLESSIKGDRKTSPGQRALARARAIGTFSKSTKHLLEEHPDLLDNAVFIPMICESLAEANDHFSSLLELAGMLEEVPA